MDILRKKEDEQNWERKHYIALCAEHNSEEAMAQSSVRLWKVSYMKAHRSRVYLTRNYPQDITWQNACDVLYKPRVRAGTEAN